MYDIQNRRNNLLSGYKKQFCFSTTSRSFLKVIQGLTFGSLFLKERESLSVIQLEEKNLNVEQMVHDEIVEGVGRLPVFTYTWYTWTMQLFCLMDRKGQASLVFMFFPPLIHCCADE